MRTRRIASRSIRSTRTTSIGSFVKGSQFEVPGSDGQPETIFVQDVTDTHVTLDRNHPMAGKPISFEATVRDIRDATSLEIEHGHPMGGDECCGSGCS